jgi:hypothetical protein
LSHLTSKMTNALFNFLSDKYDSGEASQDNCEAYLSFSESNDTLPRAPFTVYESEERKPTAPTRTKQPQQAQ